MLVAADLTGPFIGHGLLQFTTAMVQGFTIPLVSSPRLGLTCHTKTVGHAFLLFGLSFAAQHLTLSPKAVTAAKWLVLGGSWASFVGDFYCSCIAQHLPLASKAAQVACDPAEDDYSVPADERNKPSGVPHPATILVKLSAVGALGTSPSNFR